MGGTSYIEITSTAKYIVFIPVYDNHTLTAILSYANNEDYNQFHFQSINDIIQVTEDFTNLDVDTYTKIYVSALIRFQEIQYGKVYLKANNWLKEWGEENESAIEFRTASTISLPYEYWEYSESDVLDLIYGSSLEGGGGVLVAGSTEVNLPCWGGERQDEIIQAPTGSSGGITPTPPDPEDPDPETEERIKDEECKENNMTTEAINCIQNSGLEFPCEEVGTDDVWDDIVDSLCDDANDGQNSQLEGPIPGQIDCADVEIALSEYEGIDYGSLEENCKCIYDLIKQLMDINSENELIKDFCEIENSEAFTQEFEIFEGDEFPENNPHWTAHTMTMRIPEKYCNGNTVLSDLDITAQVIHELLHGHFARLFFESDFDINDLVLWEFDEHGNATGGTYNEQLWINLVSAYHGIPEGVIPSGNQHSLFYTHLRDYLQNSLHDMNNGVGNPNDYSWFVHRIINTENLATSPWAADLGLQFFNNQDNFENWVNNVGGEDGFNLQSNCN